MLQPVEVVLSIAPASTTSGSHWRAVCSQSVLAGKHERAAAAIAIQVDAKEQLQQQMGALTAAQSGGLQDDSAGEDEEDEVVTVDDDAPINLSQFGKAFKVSKASALPLAAFAMGSARQGGADDVATTSSLSACSLSERHYQLPPICGCHPW